MTAYGVKNLRRLRDITPIELKPITIIVGRNSSGKSTFLRSLPLLNQSLKTKTSGAILWWGDYVDFGSFKDALYTKADTKEIFFSFVLNNINILHRFFFHRNTPELEIILKNVSGIIVPEVRVNVGISSDFQGENSSSSYVSTFEINFNEMSIVLKIDNSGEIRSIKINNENIQFKGIVSDKWGVGNLFPLIGPARRIGSEDVTEERAGEIFVSQLLETIFKNVRMDGELSKGSAGHQIIGTMLQEVLSNSFDAVVQTGSRPRQKRDAKYLLEGVEIDRSRALRLLIPHILPTIINSISVDLRQLVSSVVYMGPARVRSERYYRKQDLSVSEIAADGTNFPMFLASLSQSSLDEFSDVLESLYNYRVELKRDGGHISIVLTEGDFKTNLIDMGYGLSQILPVIAQMWWARRHVVHDDFFYETIKNRLVVIEQPELHLHPAHQAILADTFAKFINPSKSGEVSLNFIVETHSESLINRFGQLISDGAISKDDVQVVIFEEDMVEEHSTVATIAKFAENGSLNNWPFGFFAG